MKKINNSEDTQDDVDNFRKKKLKTEVTDQMVPIPENSSLHKEKEDLEEIHNQNDVKRDEISLPDQLCKIISQDPANSFSDCDDAVSPRSCEGSVLEGYSAEGDVENFEVENCTRCSVIEDAPANYEIEETQAYDTREVSEIYDPTDPPVSYISGDSVLSSSEVVSDSKGLSPLTETASTTYTNAPVEELVNDEADEQEDAVEGETEVRGFSFTPGESTDVVESNSGCTVIQGESDIVPEVEDVTCDSGGETLLIMKHDTCSNEGEVSKPNLSAEEEMTYTDQLNSIESVDEVIFHARNTVIDSGSTSASLHIGDSSVVKCRDGRFVHELPERESDDIVRYSDSYREMSVATVFPKSICSTALVTAPIPESSESDLYVYDASVQNMVFCTNSAVVDTSSCSVNPVLNGLEPYSFHRVPVESSSSIKNMNDRYSHVNTEMCPILQHPNFGIDNRDIKSVRRLSSDEDFMRRIEKTLFESKIENKVDDTVSLKYKSELDFSLPLKKRIKTLAALSNITCATEKCVSPKEDSFPSYPAKPMISIAELEFTKGLLPKPGMTYQDNYK